MGRNVGQRAGQYDGDVAVVLRIAKAVEQDSSVTPEWRKKASDNLRAAVRDLLQPERVGTSQARPKKVAGG